jgi:uncharacterized protein YoxC
MVLLPVVPELAGLMATFMLVLALMMLSWAYRYTLGAVLSSLAGWLQGVAFTVFRHRFAPFAGIGADIAALDNGIRHALGAGIDAAQYGFNVTLKAVAITWQELSNAVAGLAHDTVHVAEAITKIHIPKQVITRLGPVWAAVTALQAAVHDIRAHWPKVLHAVTHVVTHATTIVKQVYHDTPTFVTKTFPTAIVKAIAAPVPRLGWLERKAASEAKRLGRVEKIVTVIGLTGLTAAVISRLGLGWARCSKVGRVGRAVCGMNDGLLDDLLLGTLLVAGSISIVQLAKECQAFTDDVEAGVRFFVREVK